MSSTNYTAEQGEDLSVMDVSSDTSTVCLHLISWHTSLPQSWKAFCSGELKCVSSKSSWHTLNNRKLSIFQNMDNLKMVNEYVPIHFVNKFSMILR